MTSTPVESVSMAMNNGCDLNCGNLFHFLTQAVENGMVDEKRLDEAVENLFMARMKLGVLDKKKRIHSIRFRIPLWIPRKCGN